MKDVLRPVANWMFENWPLVALILSEAAAYLPKHFNGIIQTILRIGGKMFERKVSKSKNYQS